SAIYPLSLHDALPIWNFTCPNRDGTKGYGGCTYCNVDSFTPDTARKIPSIQEQVQNGITRARNSYGAETSIIYFQPNTNTYAPTDRKSTRLNSSHVKI